jgi:4a-hydroxytetrahydrobiopterin dehydratase
VHWAAGVEVRPAESSPMSELTEMTCEACRFDAPKVTDSEKSQFHNEIPGWEIVNVDDIERLRRVFKLKNYAESVAFTNRIADMAEAEDHHPLIVLEWGRVTVEWWSHKIKGLHRNDFIAAAKTDSLLPQSE